VKDGSGKAISSKLVEQISMTKKFRIKRVKTILLFALLIACPTARSQNSERNKVELMQGIWDYTMNTDTSKYYKIVSGKNCLSFSYTRDNNDLEFTLFEMVIGFQNITTKYDETEFIHVDSLKESGLYYTEIINKNYISEGTIDETFCIIASYFECNGEVLSINGGKLFEFEKVEELPFEALGKLYRRGLIDGRNYIKDYLNLKFQSIKPLKCVLYSEPNKPMKTRLNRNNIVIVIEENDKWVKIKYSEGEGWVRKSDLR